MRFQRRPRILNNCCLADSVSQFNLAFPKKTNNHLPDQEYLLEDEQIEEDEDDLSANETAERDIC